MLNSIAGTQVEALEARRLLSLVPLGGEASVPAPAPVGATDVAVADDGNYLIATATPFTNGTTALTVSAVRYSASGQQLGGPIELFSQSTPGVPEIAASMDADGDAVVAFNVWETTNADSDPGTFSLYFARISRSGVVSDRVLVDSLDAPSFDQRLFAPAVSIDASGGFFVGWMQDVTRDVHTYNFRAYNAAGAPRAAAFSATENSPFSIISNLDLDATPDGSGAVFAGLFSGSDSLVNETHFGRIDTDSLIDIVHVDRTIGGSDGAPSVVAFDGGSFLVGFHNSADLLGPGTSIVQRYDAFGEAVGSQIRIGDSLGSGKDIGPIKIDDMPDGGFVATFIYATVNPPAGSVITATYTLYVSRYDAAGNVDESGAIAIDTLQGPTSTNGDEFFTSEFLAIPSKAVGADANGRVIVAHVEGNAASYQRLVSDFTDIALLENGILYVLGTSAADTISVSLDGSDIVVTRGTATKTFVASAVNVIDVSSFGGDDTITNDTALKATLRGGDGNDTIFGGSAEDRIHGGIGNDALWGRDGADKIFGEDGVDSLYGNGSNDRLEGGAQGDHIRGNGGRDKLFGNGGNDRLYGGESGDWIYGQAGNDQIFGEGGNDRLYGDDGFADTLRGGAGNDVFITLDSVIDQLFGDGGRDSSIADDTDLLTSIESRG
jgi:Ca2+-binding RTX toxin-like protein